MLPKVNVSIVLTITVDIAIKANNETTVSIIACGLFSDCIRLITNNTKPETNRIPPMIAKILAAKPRQLPYKAKPIFVMAKTMKAGKQAVAVPKKNIPIIPSIRFKFNDKIISIFNIWDVN